MEIAIQSPNLDKLQRLLDTQIELCKAMMDNVDAIGRTMTAINAKEIQPSAEADG